MERSHQCQRSSHEIHHQPGGGRAMKFVRDFLHGVGILSPMVREFIPLSGEAGVVEQIFLFICKVAGMMLEQGRSTSPLIMCIHAFCRFIAFGFELHRNGYFVIWILMFVFISVLALIA
ncbi:hypothetical protein CDL15_Pgr004634 [Punica granatum]|uniref:Uncharacterized protein n=1 Tax=Punica granatum TaxID=22663 RepID=A0A218WPS1_PUNGR|nr:hypothetical protein CDL15_Pgr004634 [Punica granatum]